MISFDRGTMYSRTQNENGTFNTRCLYCFMTIASAVESEGKLEKLEEKHICPERALAVLLEQEKQIQSRLLTQDPPPARPN
jgi:hypothetical protein